VAKIARRERVRIVQLLRAESDLYLGGNVPPSTITFVLREFADRLERNVYRWRITYYNKKGARRRDTAPTYEDAVKMRDLTLAEKNTPWDSATISQELAPRRKRDGF
jgi:hypothetical protein